MGAADWVYHFHAYSLAHAGVVLVFTVLTALAVALRRRWQKSKKARRLDLILAGACAAVWLIANAAGLMPGRYDVQKALPLHVCDLAGVVAPLTLCLRYRALRAILYFWALGLCTQAFIQPDLAYGPASLEFWSFWATHFALVGAAVYDVAGRGYRPTWKDWGIGCLTAAAYVALILPIDIAFGLNYGYVGNAAPGQASVVDVLGPWPGRVVIICVLAAAVLTLLQLPWLIARRPPRETTPE